MIKDIPYAALNKVRLDTSNADLYRSDSARNLERFYGKYFVNGDRGNEKELFK